MNSESYLARQFRALFAPLSGPVYTARLFFVLMVIYLAYQFRPDPYLALFNSTKNLLFTGIAFCAAVFVVVFEYATNIISSKKILLAACGLFCGLLTAYFFYPIIPEPVASPALSHAACAAVFGYFGVVLAIKHAERFQLSNLKFILSNPQGSAYILDTSVIIDGRIADLLELKFMRGPILVPQFVLNELQNIADSPDSSRRAKGRRGLDVLESILQTCPETTIWNHDYPDIPEVDRKLIEMAKEIRGYLVTNDYNLEKVAQLQRIEAININELANALRPATYVGHTFRLDMAREGKEPHQGVGYLDDGTMVVVDDGRKFVGREIDVTVSSILQTSGGRMVFARPKRSTDDIAKAS